jgi:hypothetical protein
VQPGALGKAPNLVQPNVVANPTQPGAVDKVINPTQPGVAINPAQPGVDVNPARPWVMVNPMQPGAPREGMNRSKNGPAPKWCPKGLSKLH